MHRRIVPAVSASALVILTTLLIVGPALAANHVGGVTDTKACWATGCHPQIASEWKASSPYSSTDPSNVFFGLQGHNVTMPQTLLNAAHDKEELVSSECITCHSPFSTRHLDGTTTSAIAEHVNPVNRTGPWSLVEPYLTGVTLSDPSGFYFPVDHATDTTHAGWEGISCRVCHDVDSLDANGTPRLRFFDAATYAYQDVTSSTDLCTRCHQTGSDDSRTPDAASVHASLACADCHMTNTDGSVSHTLSAGSIGGNLANTSCGRTDCHVTPPYGIGHPDVTTLATSLKDPTTYAADPINLKWSASQRHNVHFLTCDTCHKPTLDRTSYTIVYGKSLTITGSRSDKTLPSNADSGVVSLWSQPRQATHAYTRKLVSGNGSPSTAFALAGFKPTRNSYILVTQANAAGATTANFPGLGRGVKAAVNVKVKVSLGVSKAKVYPGTTLILSGKVLPNHKGKKVAIQRSRTGSSWTTWRTLKLTSTSSFKTSWTSPTKTGRYYFRARFADADGRHVTNTSANRLVTVIPRPVIPVLTSLSASVSDSTPAQYTDVTAYGKAKDQLGRPIGGVKVSFTWHYKTVTHTMTAYTNASGVASVTRNISGATAGLRVPITVTANYKGAVRTTTTGFTPH